MAKKPLEQHKFSIRFPNNANFPFASVSHNYLVDRKDLRSYECEKSNRTNWTFISEICVTWGKDHWSTTTASLLFVNTCHHTIVSRILYLSEVLNRFAILAPHHDIFLISITRYPWQFDLLDTCLRRWTLNLRSIEIVKYSQTVKITIRYKDNWFDADVFFSSCIPRSTTVHEHQCRSKWKIRQFWRVYLA